MSGFKDRPSSSGYPMSDPKAKTAKTAKTAAPEGAVMSKTEVGDLQNRITETYEMERQEKVDEMENIERMEKLGDLMEWCALI